MCTAGHSVHPCLRESPAHLYAEGTKTEYIVWARASQTIFGSLAAVAAGHLPGSLSLKGNYPRVLAVSIALLDERHVRHRAPCSAAGD